MSFISKLKSLHKSGVCVIKKDPSNISIVHSSNMASSIISILSSIPQEGKILEVIPECVPEMRRFLAFKVYEKYKAKGYKVSKKGIASWKLRVRVGLYNTRPGSGLLKRYRAFVEVYNSNTCIVLGVFNNRSEAREWKEEYYKEGIVMASNTLTKEWYERR